MPTEPIILETAAAFLRVPSSVTCRVWRYRALIEAPRGSGDCNDVTELHGVNTCMQSSLLSLFRLRFLLAFRVACWRSVESYQNRSGVMVVLMLFMKHKEEHSPLVVSVLRPSSLRAEPERRKGTVLFRIRGALEYIYDTSWFFLTQGRSKEVQLGKTGPEGSK